MLAPAIAPPVAHTVWRERAADAAGTVSLSGFSPPLAREAWLSTGPRHRPRIKTSSRTHGRELAFLISPFTVNPTAARLGRRRWELCTTSGLLCYCGIEPFLIADGLPDGVPSVVSQPSGLTICGEDRSPALRGGNSMHRQASGLTCRLYETRVLGRRSGRFVAQQRPASARSSISKQPLAKWPENLWKSGPPLL